MAAHSILGASSADRWMACPGSVRLIEQSGTTGTTSIYAAEGSAAHRVAELCLTGNHEADEMVGRTIEGFEVDAEMAEAVQLYLDVVRSEQFLTGEGTISIEVPVDLTHLHPQLWGTLDTSLYGNGRLVVIDFKYGKGVAVEVQENPQLRYYALGAWRTVPSAVHITDIELIVVQPRCPHRDGPVRRWSVGAADLVRFGDELVAAAKATEDPEAELNPGEHCRWCPALATCPAVKNFSLQTAQAEFSDELRTVEQLTSEEIGTILTRIAVIDDWIRAVELHALELARQGHRIPGWKLVDKRAVRSWKDEAGAAVALAALGLPPEALYKMTLISPAQAEKALPAASRRDLEPLVARVSSGTVLAPESDKRPAIQAGPIIDFGPAPAAAPADLFFAAP